MTKSHARLRVHPHTGRPIVPLGYRRNGAPIWPILGASEDDPAAGSSGGGDESEDGTDDGVDDPSEGDDAAGSEGEDQLGDAGKQALDRMKATVKAERAKRRAAEKALAEASKPPAGDGPDPDALKAEGRKQALAEANARIVRAEIKAAAAGKLADPTDAVAFIDASEIDVDDDGNVDEDAIADAIADLLKKKPHLAVQDGKRFKGSADGGARKGSTKSIDDQIAEAEKAGDHLRAIALKQQRAAEAKANKT